MRPKIYFVVLSFSMLIGCQILKPQNYSVSSVNAGKKQVVQQTPEAEMLLDKNKEIDIEESFVKKDILQLDGFTLNKIKVLKNDDEMSEKAEIFDALLTKNGKQIIRFEGHFYSLGNQLDFGLFSFFNNQNKQLIVVDTSNRYERDWIADVTSDYKLLFDSNEYEIYRGGLARVDYDNDRIYEITATKSKDIFNFPSANIPNIRIIFQYNNQTQKFLPASQKFPEFTLKDINDQIKRFQESKEKHFYNLLQITLTYLYAGKENEAWEFYDKNFVPEDWIYGKVENKDQAKQKIINDLAADSIYKFVQSELKTKK